MSSKLNTSHIKDKNGPKRSRSAYIFFCAEERVKIKEELPDLTPREVMFELARRWKKTKTEGDISRWEEMATKDKKRCMEDYKNKGQASTEYLSKPGNKEKHLKRMRQYLEQKAKNKRDRSAWHSFCKEMRANIKEDRPDIPPREVMSEISRRWQKARTIESALQHWEEEALKQLALLLAIEPITTSDMEDFNIEQELRLRALADSFAHNPDKLCNLFGLDLAERGWNPGSWIGYFQILRGVRLSMDSGGLAIMCRNDVTCDDDSSVEEHLEIGAPCEYAGVYQIWGNVSELPKRLGKHIVTARLARLGCGSKAKGE